jgi:hypothetical protein
MANTLNASTSSGLIQTADTSGIIELQSSGSTKLTVNSSGTVIDTLKSSSGVLAAQNGMTGIVKAWANFNGSAGTITNSFNFSSMTRNGTGDYTLNFTTAMPNANYALVCGNGRAPWNLNVDDVSTANTTTSFRLRLTDGGGTNQDYSKCFVATLSS